MESKITCPCCKTNLIILVDTEQIVTSVETDIIRDSEIDQVLEKLNIEFG